MPPEVGGPFGRILGALQKAVAGFTDVAQRVLIIATDVVLVVWALAAICRDWSGTCDETLQLYGFMCMVLCCLDLVWETARCSLESALDRLQVDFRPEACSPGGRGGNQNLLGDGFASEVGQQDREVPGPGPERTASIRSSTLGRGIRREAAMKRKWTGELHSWSIAFSCFVSIIFSFFSAHDEECAEQVPHLYAYIHSFTYVFIFRLGAMILLACYRMVKNYEDAALQTGASLREQNVQQDVRLVRF